ncbi:unnamed protein product [Moneuplotes crassus]|uniref:Uncharacterized protein n=1 Tax=Euplotes crassus TaxID=5936 RepID=A0AAD1UKA1_EUPCR|nr:unnamed protein product [Moneuplotes crassus]
MDTKEAPQRYQADSSQISEEDKENKVKLNYSYVEVSPERNHNSSPAIERIRNIQNVERRNWKGIYPPTVGHPLQKNESTLETVLSQLSKSQSKADQEVSTVVSSKNEIVPRLSGNKKEIRDMVILTALLKVLKMKNFKNSGCKNKRSESRNKDSKTREKTTIRKHHETESNSDKSKKKYHKKRPSTSSVCKRDSNVLPDENNIIKNKMRKYGYYFEQETEDKGYEVIKFKCIKESEMVKKSEYNNGMYSKFNLLLFKLLKCDIKLIRSIFLNNGFSATDSHDWNCLWINSSGKSYLYENLNRYQKINHFPHSYELTRKDRLAYNIGKMQMRFGEIDFDISPETYVLPDQFDDFYEQYKLLKKEVPERNMWIIKPAAGARGKGIYITDDIDDINEDSSNVVSRYITNPLLINGFKFDLRIYVCVTSYEPLRVYVYKEGLVRFASEQYEDYNEKNIQGSCEDEEENYYTSNKDSKQRRKKRYAHLTNYSINKKNPNFVKNESSEQDDVGGKWSLSSLCKHMERIGIDMDLLWSRMYDIILKVIITGEYPITKKLKTSNIDQRNCFELYGFDIILDSELKPWLLEVNLSPSLGTDSPLDFHIKSTLLTDTFNLVGIKKFDRKKESLSKMASRVRNIAEEKKTKNILERYNKLLEKTGGKPKSKKSKSINNKAGDNNLVTNAYDNELFYSNLSSHLAKKDIKEKNCYHSLSEKCHEILSKMAMTKYKSEILETLEERCRIGNYVCIYPSEGSNIYDYFFINSKPVNSAIYEFLYSSSTGFLKDLKEDVILEVSKRLNFGEVQFTKYYEEDIHTKKGSSPKKLNTPLILELMIEYLSRLAICIKDLEGKVLKSALKENINSFVSHKAWSKKLVTTISSISMRNNELAAKLIERIEDSIFDTFHFSEFKNKNSENKSFNTFDYSKGIARKIKKAMLKRTYPIFMKSNISDKELEYKISTEKLHGTIYTQDMTRLLISEPGSGVLVKLKKMLIHSQAQSRDNSRIDERNPTRTTQTSGIIQDNLILEQSCSMPNSTKRFKSSRRIESSSNLTRETKFPIIVAQKNKKMDMSNYITYTDKFKSKGKPKVLREGKKPPKPKDVRKKKKRGLSSHYIETLYNPRGGNTFLQ